MSRLNRGVWTTARFWILAAAAVLGGCATTPPQGTQQSAIDVPAEWASPAETAGAVQTAWLKNFNDPTLEALVGEALAHNYDLRIAAAQLEAAEASARKAAAPLIPSVNLGAGAERGDDIDPSYTLKTILGVSLDVSWEIDLWGRIRSGATAAEAEARAAALELDFARLSLTAQTARAWFVATEAGLQRQIAEDNVADLEQTLRIVEARHREGMVSRQDVYLAGTDLAFAEEQLEAATNAERESVRSVELLLGRYPEAELVVREDLPVLTLPPPVGLPSELLERRPDLRAAEAGIAAAFSVSQQARAARLPRISLTSSVSTASDALRNLADPVNTFWNVGLNLLQPLIDGGRLKADVDIADARQREAVAQYAKLAQGAFAEVERSLTASGSLQRRAASLRTAEQAAGESHRLVALRYQAGESDLLNVLEAHRRWLDARQALLRVELQQLVERINLHLALGGDF